MASRELKIVYTPVEKPDGSKMVKIIHETLMKSGLVNRDQTEADGADWFPSDQWTEDQQYIIDRAVKALADNFGDTNVTMSDHADGISKTVTVRYIEGVQ
jgi:hypothetical protein